MSTITKTASFVAIALIFSGGVASISPASAADNSTYILSRCKKIEARIAETEEELVGMFKIETISDFRRAYPEYKSDNDTIAKAYFAKLREVGSIGPDVDRDEWINAFNKPQEIQGQWKTKLQYLERRHEGLIEVAVKTGCPF